MKINEVFNTELSIEEDIRTNGHLSKSSPDAFLKKMQDLFKVEAENPEEAVKKVIHLLLDKKSRTTQMYLNGVMHGAQQAGVKVDYALRQAVERHLAEALVAFEAKYNCKL